MAEDFTWRQFLLFCHRNGLYYGDRPVDETMFSWTAENKLVRYIPDKMMQRPFSGKTEKNAGDSGEEYVLVGSLERLLRKME